jgi:predicted transcriptional regulator
LHPPERFAVSASTSFTLRLPPKTRKSLDRAAKITRRSRAFLTTEALDRHLASILRDETHDARRSGVAGLLAMAGVGRRLVGEQNDEDIMARMRDFRGDD